MEQSFTEMKAHLEGTWDKAKEEILADTEVSVEQQKYLASQRAMSKMDKYSKQEVIDNDWLKREVAIHKREVDNLMSTVEELERENLLMMGELFECNVEDLKISRNFFLTQFADNDNLEDGGILEMDLEKVLADKHPMVEPPRPKRPKSAIHAAVVEKVLALPLPSTLPAEDSFMTDEDDKDDDREKLTPDEDYILSYFSFDDVHFDDYLKLGPLELKLLSISGKRMNLVPPVGSVEGEEEGNQEKVSVVPDQAEVWPVTPRMIKQTLRPSLMSVDERGRKTKQSVAYAD
ncbi:hypothetical protein NP493_494g01008 [Ridgeia piscesae]|uniref:Uncharacterized protein n=1 Tax=Ridgeia piscesae TaxID=27915 RepID=A0AAD9NQT3_RIDPI|nr:hypothetical protein NP493_494g01008 [Ridgeia piscesae]